MKKVNLNKSKLTFTKEKIFDLTVNESAQILGGGVKKDPLQPVPISVNNGCLPMTNGPTKQSHHCNG